MIGSRRWQDSPCACDVARAHRPYVLDGVNKPRVPAIRSLSHLYCIADPDVPYVEIDEDGPEDSVALQDAAVGPKSDRRAGTEQPGLSVGRVCVFIDGIRQCPGIDTAVGIEFDDVAGSELCS